MPSKATPLLQGTPDLIAFQPLRAESTNGFDLGLRIRVISRDVLNVT